MEMLKKKTTRPKSQSKTNKKEEQKYKFIYRFFRYYKGKIKRRRLQK